MYFDRDGDPELEHMINMFRLVRKEEAIIFCGLPERFRMIPDFRLANCLKPSGHQTLTTSILQP